MRSVFLAAVPRIVCLGFVACLLTAPARQGGALEPMPRPQDGTVAGGTYTNSYFDLSYPLLSGWKEGLAGPDPSYYGYYVLNTFVPQGELTGTVLVAAQDMFFAAKELGDAPAMAREVSRAMSAIDGVTVDHPPSEVMIAGRPFSRVDFNGVGLFHSTFITEIRCHLVSFNLTTNKPDLLPTLAANLNNLGVAGDRSSRDRAPACVKDQAGTEKLLTRVDPPSIAPFTLIPVRIVVATDGSVKNVNVIRATAPQRTGIETALGQWKFRAPEIDGRAAEIETGLVIEFTREGTVKYLPGDRAQQF
jgi:hypothetical protein